MESTTSEISFAEKILQKSGASFKNDLICTILQWFYNIWEKIIPVIDFQIKIIAIINCSQKNYRVIDFQLQYYCN